MSMARSHSALLMLAGELIADGEHVQVPGVAEHFAGGLLPGREQIVCHREQEVFTSLTLEVQAVLQPLCSRAPFQATLHVVCHIIQG